MATTRLHDLAAIIEDLDAAGRLARVKSSVDPRHELAGIAHQLEGGPRAVLFEAVQGQRWPVLTGLYWNRDLVAGLLGIEAKTLPHAIAAALAPRRVATVDPAVVKSGPVLDVTEKDVDLGSIPVPVHGLKDGGPSLDAVVIAKDPETSARSASLQCFQVAGRGTLRVGIDADNALAAYREKARRLDRSLWVTLNCGVAPGLHLAASASASAAAPAGGDALAIAGQFHGAPLELVPGTESDVEMAAAAMWALECEIMPGETAPAASRAMVHVRRVHRRALPVFHAILPGLEAWNSAGLLGEARVLVLLRQQVPGVTDVCFSPGGAGLYHAVVQIAAARAGTAKHAIIAAFAAFPPLKMVTVVDDDIDIRNAGDVARAMAARLDPATGVVRIDTGVGHGLDPSLPGDLGSKIGFDATQPKRAADERRFKPVSLAAHVIVTPDTRMAAQVRPVAPPAPAAPAPEPARGSAPAAASAPMGASDYDADRIWQRELAEWKKGGQSAASATEKPASNADLDETRWLKRELEAMKRQSAVTAVPPGRQRAAKPAAKPAAEQLPNGAPDHAVLVRRSSDWDENRWLTRELEAMQREGARTKPPPPTPPASPPPTAKPAPRPAAPKPEPQRAVEARAVDDEDGGFFQSGTA